jgi:hypothetical protein
VTGIKGEKAVLWVLVETEWYRLYSGHGHKERVILKCVVRI